MNGYSIDEGEMYNRKKDPKKKDPIRTTNPSPANVGGYKKNYKNSGKEQSCKNGNALYSSDQNKPKKYKEGERFVNPYNFIPFEGQCKRESLEGNKDIGYNNYLEVKKSKRKPYKRDDINNFMRLTLLFIEETFYEDKKRDINEY